MAGAARESGVGPALATTHEERGAHAAEVTGSGLGERQERANPRSALPQLHPEALRRARIQDDLLQADPLAERGAPLEVDELACERAAGRNLDREDLFPDTQADPRLNLDLDSAARRALPARRVDRPDRRPRGIAPRTAGRRRD